MSDDFATALFDAELKIRDLKRSVDLRDMRIAELEAKLEECKHAFVFIGKPYQADASRLIHAPHDIKAKADEMIARLFSCGE